jgi:hypothetical protein
MLEFKVNKYISLRLENRKTNIYLANKLFRQCKYLLIEIPIDDITSFDDIESIDEATKRLNHSLENTVKSEYNIPPEVEFWGHCSNLQVWYEYNYNTKYLHSNLAFPILKKLVEIGDSLAIRVFKEEIAKRLRSGSSSVISFLYEEGYINFLTREEFWDVFSINGDILQEIEQKIRKCLIINGKKVFKESLDKIEHFKLVDQIHSDSGFMQFTYNQGKVTRIAIYGDEKWVAEENPDYYFDDIGYLELEEFPDSLGKLESLEELILRNINLKKLPRSISLLKNLKSLSLAGNPNLKIPDFLWELKSLEILDLSGNNLSTVPKSIRKLENLRELYLYQNYMKSFPQSSIDSLKKLRRIGLEDEDFLKYLDDDTIQWLKKY